MKYGTYLPNHLFVRLYIEVQCTKHACDQKNLLKLMCMADMFVYELLPDWVYFKTRHCLFN